MRFKLIGKVRFTIGSCRDDRSLTIDDDINNAKNIKSAISKAKEMIQILYKHYGGYTDFGMAAELQAIENKK